MENFVYEYPTKVCFGKGTAQAQLPALLAAYGPNVLLAYGGGSIKKNGVYEELMGILQAADKTVTEFTGIMSNPTWDKVKEGASLAKEHHIDLVLAVGGGSVIDCCKIVCAQAVTDEDLWELEMAQHKAFSGTPIPLGLSLPTRRLRSKAACLPPLPGLRFWTRCIPCPCLLPRCCPEPLIP